MSRKLQQAMAGWLRSEADGSPAEQAEAALRRVFRSLPEAEPRAGFARRVMAQVAPGALPMSPDPFATRGLRWGLTATFLLVGTLLALVPALVPELLAGLQAEGLIALLKATLMTFGHWLSSALAFWSWLLSLMAAAARLLTSPAVAAAITSCALIACAAYRLLWDLIAQPRRAF